MNNMGEIFQRYKEVTFRCKDARIWSTRLTSLKSIVSLATFDSTAAPSSASTASEMTTNKHDKNKITMTQI